MATLGKEQVMVAGGMVSHGILIRQAAGQLGVSEGRFATAFGDSRP